MLMEMVQQVAEKSSTYSRSYRSNMNQFFYLGKLQLAISDILAVDKKLRESKTIELIEGPIQLEFRIKNFARVNWDHFTSFTHYLVEGHFTELSPRSIERLVTFVQRLEGLTKTNIYGSIKYNAKDVKPSKSCPSEILIYHEKGKISDKLNHLIEYSAVGDTVKRLDVMTYLSLLKEIRAGK